MSEDWPKWLDQISEGPKGLLPALIKQFKHDALRAYPMLSGGGSWSLRLEGLQVGQFNGEEGWLDVGRDRAGGPGETRARWQKETGLDNPLKVANTPASMDLAITALRKFAKVWLPMPNPDPAVTIKQNEHALESRILRGFVGITTPVGASLALIRPNDGIVNWGSQFPTKWGRCGSARYLDALLHEEDTPWALEIKVQGGGGVGQYYRHAIAQAVLYRQFIRTATPLKQWFDDYQLDQTRCRAAIVVPKLEESPRRWAQRLTAVASALDVAFIQVPPAAAGLRR